MKVVILAGGFGTRLEEETVSTPKPMVQIGGYPILWHIMNIFSHYGHNEFVVCLGYKGYAIKEYFNNYFLHHANVTFDFTDGKNDMTIHDRKVEPWKVTLVETGLNTQTGGRIKRIAPYIDDDEFLMTYGDGVADVNVNALIEHHKSHDKLATVTAIVPPGKFGMLEVADDDPTNNPIRAFEEKPSGGGGWVSGGFFVLNRKVFDYIDDDSTSWELEPMRRLVNENNLMAYHHPGFWQCMDTLRHKRELESLWAGGTPPWKVW